MCRRNPGEDVDELLDEKLEEGRVAALALVQTLDRMGKAAMSVLPVTYGGREYLVVTGLKQTFEGEAIRTMIDYAMGKLEMKPYGKKPRE